MLKIEDVKISELSPMMQQYLGLKQEHPDCLLFFRLGDFYELFFDDAILVAKELDLTLTARDCGLEDKAPMAGVPHHSAETYLHRLIRKGYKIAICEQVEDPAEAKGLVAREVVEILSPGTVTAEDLLEARADNWLASIYHLDRYYGLAAMDLSSGQAFATDFTGQDAYERLIDELLRLNPRELLLLENFPLDALLNNLLERQGVSVSYCPQNYYSRAEGDDKRIAASSDFAIWPLAANSIIKYIEASQFEWANHLGVFRSEDASKHLQIDSNSRLNLELTETIWERKYKGSLLEIIDFTNTTMGGRYLRRELLRPLGEIHEINARHDAVEEWFKNFICRQNLRAKLAQVIDLERLNSKIARQRLNPREFLALSKINEHIKDIQVLSSELKSQNNRQAVERLQSFDTLATKINMAINPEQAGNANNSKIIADGYSEELDKLRELASGGRKNLLELEQKARSESGIKKLKIGFNRMYGYYFEVPKSQSDEMPESFQRRQTLRNSERYINQELKELEQKITAAENEAREVENRIYNQLLATAAKEVLLFRENAKGLSELDFYSALAELAEKKQYVRPQMVEENILQVKNARHPVVESNMGAQEFVANDLDLSDKCKLNILTGPNMAGKSTYLRQTALIVILAQMGSFVPAESAVIGLCDQIFTRIGAADNLSRGQSTFMVEMLELANILKKMSSNSLLILDEIGRGTSTFDGLAIAWATIESLSEVPELTPRTLFATHYHELCDLANEQNSICNSHLAADLMDGELKFLHRVQDGPSSDSYGIEVAKLAGVPKGVIKRSSELLYELEQVNKGKKLKTAKYRPIEGQVDFFNIEPRADSKLVKTLKEIDLNLLTPLEALQLLAEMKESIDE